MAGNAGAVILLLHLEGISMYCYERFKCEANGNEAIESKNKEIEVTLKKAGR